MIRRLLSLVAGIVVGWALFVAGARLILHSSPIDLVLGAALGPDGFGRVAMLAGGSFLLIALLLSRLPLVKRLWANMGALAVNLLLVLLAALFLGAVAL